MKANKTEEESATSVVQRLIRNRKLLEEQYIIIDKRKHETAENRRMNKFYDQESEGRIQSGVKKG